MNKINWKEKRKTILTCTAVPLIPISVATAIVAPIAIVFNKKPQAQETVTVTFEDCFSENESKTAEVKVKKGEYLYDYLPEHRDNHGFLGWKTVKDDPNAEYFQMNNTPFTQNIKLYGYWTHDVTPSNNFQFVPTELKDGWAIRFIGNSSENKNLVIPSTYQGMPIKEIMDSSFSNQSFETISLPDSIQKFNDYAFSINTNLRIINMPKSLKIIKSRFFVGIPLIKELHFFNGLEQVWDGAFSGTTASRLEGICYLKRIVLPSTVQYLGYQLLNNASYAEEFIMEKSSNLSITGGPFFTQVPHLKNVILPEGLKIIPSQSFINCTALESVYIPSTVKSIESQAFYGCFQLNNVTFAENSKCSYIGYGCFYDCSSLLSITMPNYITEVGKDCFYRSGLKMLTFKSKTKWDIDSGWIPTENASKNAEEFMEANIYGSLKIVGEEDETTNLKYITDYESKCILTGFINAPTGKITIPAKIGNYKVVGISQEFCKENTDITEVEFALDEGKNYIEYIDNEAFYNCLKINKINLGDCNNLQSIGDGAFAYCFCDQGSNPLSLDLSGTKINSIGYRTFCGNSDSNDLLVSVKLPETLISIGDISFAGRKNLSTLDLTNCKDLKFATYNQVTQPIQQYGGISPGSAITTYDLSNTSFTELPNYMLLDNENLVTIKLPQTLSNIGFYSLANCPRLETVNIPANCEYINIYAFINDTNLKSVTFDDPNSKWIIAKYNGTWVTTEYNDVSDATKNALTIKQNLDSIWIKQPAE